MNRWLKREVAMAGRYRVLFGLVSGAVLFWGPIFLAAILLFAIWLARKLGYWDNTPFELGAASALRQLASAPSSPYAL